MNRGSVTRLQRRGEVFFSQAVPNSLSVQGTSSEFEVVPAEEQTSPPASSGHARSTTVSGWRVPSSSHVSSLFQSPGPGGEAQDPLRSLGHSGVTWGYTRGRSRGCFSLTYANPWLVTSPTGAIQARGH